MYIIVYVCALLYVRTLKDACLFVGDKVICIVYVYDFIFWANDEKDMHDLSVLFACIWS